MLYLLTRIAELEDALRYALSDESGFACPVITEARLRVILDRGRQDHRGVTLDQIQEGISTANLTSDELYRLTLGVLRMATNKKHQDDHRGVDGDTPRAQSLDHRSGAGCSAPVKAERAGSEPADGH